MFLSVQINKSDCCLNTEWPDAEGLPFKGVCGVIGPEAESNWITRTLDQYGNFERLISRHDKDSAISLLISHGHDERAVRVWADRFYL